ncbi:peptidoglycan-binding domain-containing protein [Dactylosporangium sp. NPDC049525]|uniref:peptidoglycan-binding domain-containing protein n=1 Tax=Dactylosporangium sp. NPDC049525 TaxID=3154730 RepID=UPI003418E593
MRTRLLAAAGVLLAAAGVVGWAVTRAPAAAPVAAPQVRTTTAAVTRGDVTARVQVAGTLGFDGSYTVANQLPGGVVTAVAALGSAVGRGADLFAVAGVPAVLLYGGTPAYRDLAAGMTDGNDVLELEQNLVALGFDPSHTITVDRHFNDATAGAIRRWQAARGLPWAQRTGRLPLGQVVFLPGPVRVGQIVADVGASVDPGAPVLAATGTARVVRVALTAGRQSMVHAGDPVRVTVHGLDQAVAGTVRDIGAVATVPSEGPGGGGAATIPVVITLSLPVGAPTLDQAPVQVAMAGAQRRNVLLVPVTALLAGPAGGYQVAVVDDAGRHLVPVQPGLFDDGTGAVEITGGGLAEGTRVEVPVS